MFVDDSQVSCPQWQDEPLLHMELLSRKHSYFTARWNILSRFSRFQVSLFFPVTFLLFCTFLLIMTLYEGAESSLIGIGICLSAIPLYAICIAWKNKPNAYFKYSRKFNAFLQKLFVCMPENKKDI